MIGFGEHNKESMRHATYPFFHAQMHNHIAKLRIIFLVSLIAIVCESFALYGIASTPQWRSVPPMSHGQIVAMPLSQQEGE